jgi:hypothetical protein
VNCFGQLVDDSSANSNGQQNSNSKINSLKKNNRLVSSDSLEKPVVGSDSVVLKDKFSKLNKKYVTQSPGTSAGSDTGYLTSTIISTIAAKKCE